MNAVCGESDFGPDDQFDVEWQNQIRAHQILIVDWILTRLANVDHDCLTGDFGVGEDGPDAFAMHEACESLTADWDQDDWLYHEPTEFNCRSQGDMTWI